MVIDDQDAVDPPALAVFCDIWKVTGISLPHFPKGVLFKSLPVPHVRVTCRFQVIKVQEILCQDTEDEEQAVAGIGDDEIREDGMGMAAGTDEAKDAEAVSDRGAVYEIHQGTVIIGMDLAAARCPAEGTGLQLGAESNHERLK
ncbi:hypothetical protein C823_005036 [Eubacterium plexicaudatum ASF492]|uniref:Uncharacterized protein n=1 Tax=Eubacterium plexicaudatum ASF492 TaxID=1235802 RepID=N2AZ01_9FIRM|nr:hypothetical protein C823_005036 [Eubacterium plexicaudatum ASF492]